MSKTLHVFWLSLVLLWGTVGRPVQAAEKPEKRAPIAACSPAVQEGFIRMVERLIDNRHTRHFTGVVQLIAYLEHLPAPFKKWLPWPCLTDAPQACGKLRKKLKVTAYWKSAFWAQDLTPLVDEITASCERLEFYERIFVEHIITSEFVWGKEGKLAKACMRRHFTTTEIPDSYLFDMLTQDELPFFRSYPLILTPLDFGRLLSLMLETFHLGLNAPIRFRVNKKEYQEHPLLFLTGKYMPLGSPFRKINKVLYRFNACGTDYYHERWRYYYMGIKPYCTLKFDPVKEQRLLKEILENEAPSLVNGVTGLPIGLQKVIFKYYRGTPLNLQPQDSEGLTPLDHLKARRISTKLDYHEMIVQKRTNAIYGIEKVIRYVEKQVNPPSRYERMISFLKRYKEDIFLVLGSSFLSGIIGFLLIKLITALTPKPSGPKKRTKHKKPTTSPQKVAGRSSAKGKLSQERGPSSARAKKNGETRQMP